MEDRGAQTANNGDRGPGPVALWFAAAGGAAAWTAHLTLTYPLVDFLCSRDHAYILWIVSGIALVWDIAAGVVGWVYYKRLPAAEQGGFTGESSRRAFMLLLGVLGSGLFFLGIVLATLPFLVFGPCAR